MASLRERLEEKQQQQLSLKDRLLLKQQAEQQPQQAEQQPPMQSAGVQPAPLFSGGETDEQQKGQGPLDFAKNAALEVIAGVNRGALSLADIPADIANAVAELSGVDFRVPTIRGSEIWRQGAGGGFVEDPKLQQALGMLGEFVAPAPPIMAVSKKGQDLMGVDFDPSTIEKLITSPSPTQQKIIDAIKLDPQSIKAGQYIIKGSKAKKDKLFGEVVKQGVQEGIAAAVKGSSQKDKAAMVEMMQILKAGLKNKRYAAEYRPTDIVGRSVVDRINYIKDVNQKAGKLISKEALKLKGKNIDARDAIGVFGQKLDDFGINIVPDKKLGFKADFSQTSLAPGDRGPIREVIRQMARLQAEGKTDGFGLHQLKRIIDRNVTYGKTAKGLSGEAERALKDFRTAINGALGDASDSYRKVNTTYSETIDALDDFKSTVGTKVDLFGGSADKSIGTQARRLLSNVQSRVPMMDAIKNLEEVAAKTGAKFDDDILTQALFADELDRVFGPSARTGFQGQIGQAVDRGVSIAKGNVEGEAVGMLKTAADMFQGINSDNAIKALDELLNR